MDVFDIVQLAGKQRVFRARGKIRTAGYISHITQRAAGREPLFLEKDDYLTMLGLLKDTSESCELSFYAFCLMPNHIHLLLEPRKDNLSEAMHSIFSRYARRFNSKYHRRGHIFGGPYRQAVCLDSCYLLAASVYIHLNPVRAGIVAKATDYRWSSVGLYCKASAQSSFVQPGPVLALIDPDQDQAREHYAAIVRQAKQEQPNNALEQEGAIEQFLARLIEMFPRLFKRVAKKSRTQESKPSIPELPDLEELMQQVAAGSPRAPETLKARKYLVEQLLARGYKKTEIAARLQLSRKTIYNILDRDH